MPDPKIIQAEIEIDAPPDDVFDILTDLDRYAEWNPFTPRIDSTLELGAPVNMRVRLFEGRRLLRQVEYVTVVNSPTQLCWGANIPLRSLVRADRCPAIGRDTSAAINFRVGSPQSSCATSDPR